MNSSIFKPIDRKTYIIGFIIVTVISIIIDNLGTTTDETGVSVSLFVVLASLFFSLIKVILAYKRIKDISSSKLYLLLLIIPIIFLFSSFFNPSDVVQLFAWPFNNQGGGSFLTLVIFIIFSLINLATVLFLMFKKGEVAPALPLVETKV